MFRCRRIRAGMKFTLVALEVQTKRHTPMRLDVMGWATLDLEHTH